MTGTTEGGQKAAKTRKDQNANESDPKRGTIAEQKGQEQSIFLSSKLGSYFDG